MNRRDSRFRTPPPPLETPFTRRWETVTKPARWVQHYGKLYPVGTPPERMNNVADPPRGARR